ncbi:hypothetical protein C8J56DRAFT_1051110 [Mycena floridula]|nr:hypothetical protein C8J56DRAFT_1051110 [Mycena floridula]
MSPYTYHTSYILSLEQAICSASICRSLGHFHRNPGLHPGTPSIGDLYSITTDQLLYNIQPVVPWMHDDPLGSNVSVPARPAFPSLMQMVELETCSLICNFRIAAGMQGTFRHLQYLKLTGDNVMIILEALVLPALLSLHVNSTVPFLEDISRILPSYPTVRALCIRRFVSDATNWQSLQGRFGRQSSAHGICSSDPTLRAARFHVVKVQKQSPAFGMSEDVAQSQREDACRSLRAIRLNLNVEYNTDDSPIRLPDLL